MLNPYTKINIVLVSLNDKFCNNVAIRLADMLDMFVADCYQMVVYDLVEPKKVLDKCGIEYLRKREKMVISRCAEFNNTVLSINFDLFNEFSSLFKNSLIIYLRLPEEKTHKVANKLDYKNRDEILKENSQIIIENDKCLTTHAVKNILMKLGELYENC